MKNNIKDGDIHIRFNVFVICNLYRMIPIDKLHKSFIKENNDNKKTRNLAYSENVLNISKSTYYNMFDRDKGFCESNIPSHMEKKFGLDPKYFEMYESKLVVDNEKELRERLILKEYFEDDNYISKSNVTESFIKELLDNDNIEDNRKKIKDTILYHITRKAELNEVMPEPLNLVYHKFATGEKWDSGSELRQRIEKIMADLEMIEPNEWVAYAVSLMSMDKNNKTSKGIDRLYSYAELLQRNEKLVFAMFMVQNAGKNNR